MPPATDHHKLWQLSCIQAYTYPPLETQTSRSPMWSKQWVATTICSYLAGTILQQGEHVTTAGVTAYAAQQAVSTAATEVTTSTCRSSEIPHHGIEDGGFATNGGTATSTGFSGF